MTIPVDITVSFPGGDLNYVYQDFDDGAITNYQQLVRVSDFTLASQIRVVLNGGSYLNVDIDPPPDPPPPGGTVALQYAEVNGTTWHTITNSEWEIPRPLVNNFISVGKWVNIPISMKSNSQIRPLFHAYENGQILSHDYFTYQVR